MLRHFVIATLVLTAVTLAAVPAGAQMRLPSSPITLNKSADAPKARVDQSTLTVPAGKWGTSEPFGRPCYAGMISEPCSTPGPSVRIELPGFRVKK